VKSKYILVEGSLPS